MWVRFGEARTDKDMPGGAELFAHVLVQGWLMDPRERLVARRHLVLIDHAAGRTSADQAIKSMRKIASEMRGRGSYGPAATTNLLMADHQLSRGTPEPQTIRLASQLLADAKSDAALSRDQRLWGLLQWYYGTLPLAPSPELLRHALRNLDAEGAPEAGVLLDTMDTDTPQKPRFSLYGLHEVWHRRPA
jgi:hypothetical protein